MVQRSTLPCISSLTLETDYCVPKLNFNLPYEALIPSREDSKTRPHQLAHTINIFTDFSKLDNQVVDGLYSPEMGIYDSMEIIKPGTRVINLFSYGQTNPQNVGLVYR